MLPQIQLTLRRRGGKENHPCGNSRKPCQRCRVIQITNYGGDECAAQCGNAISALRQCQQPYLSSYQQPCKTHTNITTTNDEQALPPETLWP